MAGAERHPHPPSARAKGVGIGWARVGARGSQPGAARVPGPIGRGVSLLQYAAIVVGIGLLLWAGVRNLSEQNDPIVLGAVIVTSLLMSRQIFVVRENGRLLAQAARRQARIRFEHLGQHGSDVIVLIDPDLTIRYLSPNAERVLGWAPQASAGSSLETMVDPTDRDAIRALVAAALAGPAEEPTEAVDIRCRHADGSVRILESVATQTVDESGRPVVVIDSRDATERHAATEALRLSEARNRALLDAIPDQIVRFDNEGRYLGFLGTPVHGSAFTDEVIGKTLPEIAPTFAQAGEARRARIRATEESRTQEMSYTYERPEGLGNFEARVAPLPGGEVIAIIRDVTDTKKATARLHRLAEILDATPDYVWSQHMDGQIMYANAAFRELIGISPGDDPDDIARAAGQMDDVRRAFAGTAIPAAIRDGSWHGDVDVTLPDGRVVPVSLVILAHQAPDGSVDHVSGIGRNIEQRRQTELELVAAKEAAEAASQAKGNFLAAMSHEIRTPMNGIIGATDLILDTELSDEQRVYGQTLRESSEALLGIINDILDFSKIEANRLEIETIEFDLRATVEGVCGVLASAAHRHGLELFQSIQGDVPTALRGDPARLRQILMNLVGNAIKFTETGEVVVRVALDDRLDGEPDGGRARIRFEVSDTGIGIVPELQALLFQPFAQADGTMSRRYGGTGLGLAISRQLVQLMGGEMGVHSRVGEGSNFWFTMCFGLDPAPRPTGETGLRSARILLVDGNSTSRDIILELLASWGMRPLATASDWEACDAFRDARRAGDPFEAIIIDEPIAGPSGPEVALRVSAALDSAPVPILLVSSLSRRLPAADPSDAIITVHLTKPLRPSELLDALSDLLHLAGPGRSTPTGAERAASRARTPSPARILLVEDNAVNQTIALAMLDRFGYRADLAATGLDALEAAGRSTYDLILMDCQLPGLDGLETTKLIRAGEAGRRSVIVALTANATSEDRKRCLAAGMDDYLPKPVRQESLRTMLDRWLTPADGASGGTRGAPSSDPAHGDTVAVASPAAPLADEILDYETIAQIRALGEGDAEDVLWPLLDLFFSEAAGRISAIHAAIERGDGTVLADEAHALKGSALSVGARLLGNLSAQLQKIGREGGDLALARPVGAQLDQALAWTRRRFDAERRAAAAPEPGAAEPRTPGGFSARVGDQPPTEVQP